MIAIHDTRNQESRKKLGSRGRFDLIKSSAVQVKHTRNLNNTGAFASFVNACERTQEISQVYFKFFLCSSRLLTHSAEKYPATLNIVVRLLIFKNHHI